MNLKERRVEGMDRVMAMTEIRTCAAQSKSQGGVICVVKGGRLVEVLPDPDHPNGPHEVDLDPKSRVLPELLYHSEWLKRPVRWSRLGEHLWDEALESIAQKLLTIQEESGPEAVDFHRALPGGAASSDYNPWFHRLAFTFGSPNASSAMYICNWHKDFASRYTYGSGVAEPDFDRPRVLILGAGGGPDALLALYHDSDDLYPCNSAKID